MKSEGSYEFDVCELIYVPNKVVLSHKQYFIFNLVAMVIDLKKPVFAGYGTPLNTPTWGSVGQSEVFNLCSCCKSWLLRFALFCEPLMTIARFLQTIETNVSTVRNHWKNH